MRRQTYDPGSLGFPIDENIGFTCLESGTCTAPQLVVDPEAWMKAGGVVAGRASVTSSNRETIGVVLGEVPLGRGRIRISGGLLPTPTQAYNHPYGLDGYALSWTGWQVLANLLSTGNAITLPQSVEAIPRTGSDGTRSIDVALVFVALAIVVRRVQRRRRAV